jgi:peptidoglycan/LPS O-acetylase OafA/YrhL
MEQNSKSNRLHALDGLRGLAIIMVFLSHVNTTFLNRSTFWGSYFFDSGVMGVTFLFILSGFLMAYLYPQPQSKLEFLQKRYTRIFPLFLTISSALFLLRYTPNKWYLSVGILLLFAAISHLIWVYVVKRYINNKYKRLLFLLFVAFQICVGVFYLWVMMHPAIYYYSQMPMLQKSLTNWFVNATLTLPIGQYVYPLDPVYWSLAAEILFYMIYPFICTPAIAYMSKRGRVSKIILLVCLLPFFGAIVILFQHILFLSLLRFQLFYYFVTGMTLGYIYRKKPKIVSGLDKFFPGLLSYLTIILFFGVILVAHVWQFAKPQDLTWIQLFLAIPFTLLLAISLSHKTALSTFFRSKILVYIGTISYSIYLCHMFVLNSAITLVKQPHTIFTTALYIALTLLITIVLASILYFLLEKPYFKRTQIKTEKKAVFVSYIPNNYAKFLFCGISLGFLVVCFFIYQSSLNFFTIQESNTKSLINPKTNIQQISLLHFPTITFQVTADHDNFGVLYIHFDHLSLLHKKFVGQEVEFRIKDKTAKQWYSTSNYFLTYPSEDLPLFGFPIITNATGHTYLVSISQKIKKSSEYLVFDNTPTNIETIFLVDKKTLLTHPEELVAFVENKILTVLTNNEAQLVLELSLPFILFSIFILLINRHKVT